MSDKVLIVDDDENIAELMKQRVFYLLKFYLATVFFFIVAKIVFIL